MAKWLREQTDHPMRRALCDEPAIQEVWSDELHKCADRLLRLNT
jgi:hypothetical protein